MVDTPFVSEDFQRAFRNQFPSQVSSGRDLHVSDVVIPVVDFTPTASGASLPESLRFSLNRATTKFTATSSTSSEVIGPNSGFLKILANLYATSAKAQIDYFFVNTATSATEALVSYQCATDEVNNHNFISFIPAGFTLKAGYTLSGSSQSIITATYLADVNGNLTNPTGYDPQ